MPSSPTLIIAHCSTPRLQAFRCFWYDDGDDGGNDDDDNDDDGDEDDGHEICVWTLMFVTEAFGNHSMTWFFDTVINNSTTYNLFRGVSPIRIWSVTNTIDIERLRAFAPVISMIDNWHGNDS